jgi:hypothetical protein
MRGEVMLKRANISIANSRGRIMYFPMTQTWLVSLYSKPSTQSCFSKSPFGYTQQKLTLELKQNEKINWNEFAQK